MSKYQILRIFRTFYYIENFAIVKLKVSFSATKESKTPPQNISACGVESVSAPRSPKSPFSSSNKACVRRQLCGRLPHHDEQLPRLVFYDIQKPPL